MQIRNMNLNRISDFLKIVELGNITRAANALGEPKAKLSRNLALLEADLGVQLVYRTTRQFQLTQAGLQFYQETQPQMADLEASILGLRKNDEKIEGKIKVTAPEDLGNQVVTTLVSEFSKLYSQVEFELIYTNAFLDLVKLGVDIAFRVGTLKDSSLVHKKVGSAELILVAAPAYLSRHGSIEKIETLADHQLIGFANPDFSSWKLTSGSESKTLKVKTNIKANTFTSVLDLAIRGHGVAYLPKFLAETDLNQGRLFRLLKGWGHKGSPIQLVMPQQKKVPRRIRAFFEFSTKKMIERFA